MCYMYGNVRLLNYLCKCNGKGKRLDGIYVVYIVLFLMAYKAVKVQYSFDCCIL